MNDPREELRRSYLNRLDKLVLEAENAGFYATVEREVMFDRGGKMFRYYLLDMRDSPTYYRGKNAEQT